jgi:hypothetical protein
MILDSELLYCDDQDISALNGDTLASTNVIDHGLIGASSNPNLIGVGEAVNLVAIVTTAVAGGTSLQIQLETDTDAAFPSADVLYDTGAVAVATLVVGYEIPLLTTTMPAIAQQQFTRILFTAVGDISAGALTIGLLANRQHSFKVA